MERMQQQQDAHPSKSVGSATYWSFTWRVLALLGRQVTFLCSLNLLRLPFVCCYYFYVWIPLFFLALALKYVLIILQVSSRRSTSFKRLIKHYVAFHQTIINIIRKIRRSSLSELTEWILTTVYEVVFTIFDESAEDSSLYDVSNPLHFAELIGYMELEESHNPQQRRRDKRMRHLMHNPVPSRPFRASVRIHQHSHSSHSSHSDGPSAGAARHEGGGGGNGVSIAESSCREQSLADVTARWLKGKRQSWLRGGGGLEGRRQQRQGDRQTAETDADYVGGSSGMMSSGADRLMHSFGFRSHRTAGGISMSSMTGGGTGTCSASGCSELWSEVESVSRTSVPRSPETFARVMDRSRDRVDSVVFFVRDKLRLEEQRLSHDENSRSMASRLLGKGKFGVFDPYHTNKAIELTHGLHCAGVRKTRGASSSLLLLPVQSLASTAPAPSPVRRGRGSRDSGRDEKEQEPGGAGDRGSAGRSSNSLDSLESCGSSGLRGLSPAPPAPPPRFFSTRAAIPLMQDAFVYFEYFIKSTSPGSLTSSGASSAHMHAETPPVVSLGLASCDFSLDSMVGDDDRSVGLGLFPEDCLHPCRLYLSGTTSSSSSSGSSSRRVQEERRRLAAEQDEDEEAGGRGMSQDTTPVAAPPEGQRKERGGRSSFEMLGGPQPSSGDRIGVLVYIQGGRRGAGGGGGGGRSRSSFGKDPSTDCLFAEGGGGGDTTIRQKRAGCTPRQAPRDLLPTPDEDEYEYDFTQEGVEEEEEEDYEFEEEGGEDGRAEARLAALLGQGLLEEEEDEEEEEDGMHVCFNLNGCPLHVPWPAVGQISEMPWGQTALYPTLSFAVAAPASSPPLSSAASTSSSSPLSSPAPPQKLQTCANGSSSSSLGLGQGPGNTENTVKIWGGFCVDDVQYKTREAIGAPPGVCVYCLDGSVLLGEGEDEDSGVGGE